MALLNFKLQSCERTAELYKNLIDEFSIVAITDKRGVIVDVNQRFIEISGYSREELVGSTHKIINSGFHSKDFWKGMWEHISLGKTFRATIKNRNKDGNHYWVDTMIYPVLDDNGKPEFYFSVRNLVTEVIERRLREKIRNEELHSIVSKTRSLVHDLSNSLTIIYAGTSRDGLYERTIKSVRRAAEASIELTKSIREGLREYERCASCYTEGATFIQNFLYDCHLLYSDCGVIFKLDCNLKEYGWNLPPQELNRILQNLVKNSVEAMSSVNNKVITLKIESKKNNPRFSISDTGVGISKDHREKIFVKGFSTKNQFHNDGFGLFNIREILKSYGFEIYLRDSEEGASFDIAWVSEF